MGIIKKGKRRVYINKKIQQQKNQRQEQTVIVNVSNNNKRRASAPRPKPQYNNQPPTQHFYTPTLQQAHQTQINEEFINRIISRIPTHHIAPEPKLSHSPASVASYSNVNEDVVGSPASVSFYKPKEPISEYKEMMETPREDLRERMRLITQTKRKKEKEKNNDSDEDIGTMMTEVENIEATMTRQERMKQQIQKKRQEKDKAKEEAKRRNIVRVEAGGKPRGRPIIPKE